MMSNIWSTLILYIIFINAKIMLKDFTTFCVAGSEYSGLNMSTTGETPVSYIYENQSSVYSSALNESEHTVSTEESTTVEILTVSSTDPYLETTTESGIIMDEFPSTGTTEKNLDSIVDQIMNHPTTDKERASDSSSFLWDLSTPGKYQESTTKGLIFSPFKKGSVLFGVGKKTGRRKLIIDPYKGGKKPLYVGTPRDDMRNQSMTLLLFTTTETVNRTLVLLDTPETVARRPEVIPETESPPILTLASNNTWMLNEMALRGDEETPEPPPPPHPCKCSCLNKLAYCKVPNTIRCLKSCAIRCRIGDDTIDEYGRCPGYGECNCFFSNEEEPICVAHTDDVRPRDLRNYQHMYCHNVCEENKYSLLYEGICSPILDNLVEERKNQKWWDGNWYEKLNATSMEYVYEERSYSEESTEEPPFRYPERTRYVLDEGKEEEEYFEKEKQIKEEEQRQRHMKEAEKERELLGVAPQDYDYDEAYPDDDKNVAGTYSEEGKQP